jgi:hypothetical protein
MAIKVFIIVVVCCYKYALPRTTNPYLLGEQHENVGERYKYFFLNVFGYIYRRLTEQIRYFAFL